MSLLLDYALSYTMKVTPLTSFDEFWLTDNGQDSWGYSYFWPQEGPEVLDEPGDSSSQLKNIVYLIKVDKTNLQRVKDFVKEKWSTKLPIARSKLTQIFGRYYWIDMGDDVFEGSLDMIIRPLPNVTTKDQLLS